MLSRRIGLGLTLGLLFAGVAAVCAALVAYRQGYTEAVARGKAITAAIEEVVNEREKPQAEPPQVEYTWDHIRALYQAMNAIDKNERFMDVLKPRGDDARN